MKKQVIKFANFAVGPILSGVIMAIIIPLTTYFLSPSEYGKASMFNIIQGLVASLAYFGFDQAFTREYNDYKDKQKLFMNSIVIPLSIFLLMFLISLFFLKDISSWIYPSSNYATLVVAFECLIISTIFERFILMYIRMNEDGKSYSFYTTLIKIFILIFTLILIFGGNRTFEVIIWSTILGQVCADTILIYKYRQLFNINIKKWLDKKLIKKMFIFGLPIVLSVSITNFLQMSDRVFLNTYSTYHELGVYSAGLKIMAIMSIIQTIFVNYWVPISYRWLNEEKKIENFQLVSDAVNIILGNIVFFMSICGPIITLFLSKSYADVQYYFPLLVFTVYLSCVSETTNLGIVFSRKTYLNIYVSAITLVVNICLSFIFIPNYSSRGAALSNALSFIVFFVLRTLLSAKQGFKININSHIIVMFYLFFSCVIKAFSNLQWYYSMILYIPFLIFTVLRLRKIFALFTHK